MLVIFTRSDDTAEKAIDVSPDSKLGESREAVQMLFGLPENPPYKLVLERTEEQLKDNLTFEEAGIHDNDKLILSPPTDKKTPPPEPTPAPTPSPPPAPLTPPPPPSTLDWRTAVIIGGVIGVFGLVGLVLSQNRVVVIEPTPQPSPITPVSPKPRPVTPPAPSQPLQEQTISRQKAVNLIQKYLDAKEEMFAPPYNRQILAEIGTSEFYEERIGTINWLQNRNAYYVYKVQSIKSVEEFISQNNEATIKVRITEDYTLHNSDGSVDSSSSNFKSLTVIYNMRLINGSLKIYASKII